VFIRVKPHDYFEREGDDLYCAVPISITQAALGGEINVTSLDGKTIKIKVPAGTQNGKLLRIRDLGVPNQLGHRGYMYVKFMVQVPTRLSRQGKELLESLSRETGENESPQPIPLSELGN
jgi:molecular chaperone DnaJ